MTTLLLVRHGETDWNRELRIQGSSDTDLNEAGRSQARALAHELDEVVVDAIYSSDLTRARETAEIVAKRKGLDVRLDPRLRERSFGSWEGLTRAEIAERFPDLGHHDGETDEQVSERVLEAVRRIVDSHPGEEVLVVSHGGALNALWHHAFGERIERWGNCAAYRLGFRDGEFRAVD